MNLGQGGSINHLAVEVADTQAADTAQRRLAQSGLAAVEDPGSSCCDATQDKFWVHGAPNGERREI